MRRGVSLVEIVAALPLLIAVTVLFTAVFATSLEDVPKIAKVADTHHVLSAMLERMQEDVDAAISLPGFLDNYQSDEGLLLIEQPSQIVFYEVKEGQIVRTELSKDGGSWAEHPYIWPVPQARVSFSRPSTSGLVQAVEVHTAVLHIRRQQVQEKLVNRHIFHLSALGYHKVLP